MGLYNKYESENLLLDFDIVSVHFRHGEWKEFAGEFHACLSERPSLNPLTAAD